MTAIITQGELNYYAERDRLCISVGHRGLFETDCDVQRVVCHVTPDLVCQRELLRYLVFGALIPLLRRKGIFVMHAFAAAKECHAVLLVGESGSGKTTTGLGLVRAGWSFLANDRVLLRQAASRVIALSHDESININPSATAFLPELRGILDDGSVQSNLSFDIEQVYGDVRAEEAAIDLLLFPRISDIDRSITLPISPSEALSLLLSQGLDGWDKETAATHFSILANLAQQIPAYRLHLGRDTSALPDLVNRLLQPRQSVMLDPSDTPGWKERL